MRAAEQVRARGSGRGAGAGTGRWGVSAGRDTGARRPAPEDGSQLPAGGRSATKRKVFHFQVICDLLEPFLREGWDVCSELPSGRCGLILDQGFKSLGRSFASEY